MGKATRGKGEGSVYQLADGTWRGTIEVGWATGGKRVRRSARGQTKRAVLLKLKKVRDEIEAGVVGDDSTVAVWLDHWLTVICPQRGLKRNTLYGYESYVKQWIVPTIGHRRLKSLSAEHVRELHTAMRDAGKAPGSIRQAHAILSRALKVAEREGKVRRNVAALVDVPSPGGSHHAELTTEQAKKVLKAARTPRELARLTCALVLGLRQGEALGLHWSDVDLEAGSLEVSEALTIERGVGPILDGVKSKASRRLIPLPAPVVAVLRAWKDAASDEVVFPSWRLGKGLERDPKRDWEQWVTALDAAGVPRVPLHGARASAASLLMEMGVPDRVIADILGHAQIATTQRHYLRSSEAGRIDALTRAAKELLPEYESPALAPKD